MAGKTKFVRLTRMSRVFQPLSSESGERAEVISKSHKLMLNYGIIKPVSVGMFALLPLGVRIFNKLIELVDKEMANIGAEKILLPALTPAALWRKTGRYDSGKAELFTLTDRHKKEYILSPTYEEAICDVVSSAGDLSAKSLPLKLYQISSKWRDEMKPRHGFLRSREFIMKDLYTFDSSLVNARHTYDLVCESYNNIFRQIGIKYTKSIGDVGTIGGLMSHEYHYASDIGEDTILQCPSCNLSINQTVSTTTSCPECKSELQRHAAAEVGHTFLLDVKYSQPLQATYVEHSNEGRKSKPLVMGCFGLGLSRIIMLAVEILSTNNEIRWPAKLAPYTVCIVPPKAGSKEDGTSVYVEQLSEILCKRDIDTILDDRTQHTIGKRLILARASGYPYIIVIGKAATQSVPLFEIHDVNNSTYQELSLDQISDYFGNINCKN